jgi:hypothetical protein
LKFESLLPSAIPIFEVTHIVSCLGKTSGGGKYGAGKGASKKGKGKHFSHVDAAEEMARTLNIGHTVFCPSFATA